MAGVVYRYGVMVYRGGRNRGVKSFRVAYIWRYICDRMAGRIFAGYYMADFTGVNGRIIKKSV